MSNYKFKKHKLFSLVFLLLIAFSSITVGYDKSRELSKRKLVTTGDGSMVSAYDYFQDVVKQVGGFVAIRSSGDKDLRKINLPQSFVKGQVLRDVFNNFCTVYKGFDYEFGKNVVNIYPTKKVTSETRIIENYDFEKGALYVGISMYLNLYKPFYVTGYEEIGSEPMGFALSVDYMVSSRFSLGIGLHQDRYKTEDDGYDMSWEYYNLKFWFDYHYRLFGAHFYTGVGLGMLFKGGDTKLPLYTEIANTDATLDGLVYFALRTGVMLRLYKNFFYRAELFVANKGFIGFDIGVSLKL